MITKNAKPSTRGDMEITIVNQDYFQSDVLKMQILSRGFACLDTGTQEALTKATEYVKSLEKQTGVKIAWRR